VNTTLLKAGLRDWSRHPWQAGLAVIGVAVGVAVVVAVDLANGSALKAFDLASEAVLGRATHQVVGDSTGLRDDLYRRLRVDHAVRPSAPVVEGLVEIDGRPDMRLRLLGLDPFAERDFRSYVGGGPGGELDLAAFLTRRGAVLLSERTARDLGVEQGDEFALLVGGRPVDAFLAGVLRPQAGAREEALAELMVADIATAQEILGLAGRLSRIDLILDSGAAGETTAERVARLLPPGARLQPAAAGSAAATSMTRAFRLNLKALGLLALLCGGFLIYNTVAFGVVRRRRLLGVLRCLGAGRRKLLALVLGESLLIGLAGSLLGAAAGQLLGRRLLGLVTQTINDLYFAVTVRSVELAPGTYAKGVLLGLAIAAVAALAPAIEAMSVAPRSALARSELESRLHRLLPMVSLTGLLLAGLGGLILLPDWGLVAGFVGMFAVLLGAASLTPAAAVLGGRLLARPAGRLFGQLGRIATRGLETALSRTAVAVAALSMAVAVTVGVDLMIRSFRDTVTRWLELSLPADLYLSIYSTPGRRFTAHETFPTEVVDRLRNLDGVARLNSLRHLELATEAGPLRALAIDLDARSYGALEFRSGRPEEIWPAFQAGEAIIVSEPLANRRGLAVGSELLLPTPSGELPLPVAGVYSDYASDQGAMMLSRALYDRAWADDAVTAISLHATSEAALDELTARVRAAIAEVPGARVRSSRGLRQESLEVFDRTFLITDVLRLLAVIVALVGVLSALMALQLDRERELGVLRALGLTPGQLWAVVSSQTAVLGLIAGLLAAPLGWIMAVIMVRVINLRSFGWTIELNTQPGPFVAALALAVGAALAAGIYPAWKMARTSPASALREE
jgi:putative ABC transport system permease protein